MTRTWLMVVTVVLSALMGHERAARSAELPKEKAYANSIAMKFVRIEPGSFEMGQLETLPWQLLPAFRGRGLFDLLYDGDFDERPIHNVRITKPLYAGVFQVTNFQYELYDPDHKVLRGKNGVSTEDDDAVVNVNWYGKVSSA